MRSEYAKRTKEKLWVNKVDMVENIERNLIEYAYERYNPVTVCEENDMYLCTVTNGESLCVSTLTYMPQTLPHNNLNCFTDLIHPVHIDVNQSYVVVESPDSPDVPSF